MFQDIQPTTEAPSFADALVTTEVVALCNTVNEAGLTTA
jgi:hypothetical protein